MPKFEVNNNKKYEMKTIYESAVYTKVTDGHLQRLYYLVAWKDYLKEENT